MGGGKVRGYLVFKIILGVALTFTDITVGIRLLSKYLLINYIFKDFTLYLSFGSIYMI